RPARPKSAAGSEAPSPPPRWCFGSEAEVQLANHVDLVFVACRRPAREALEDCQHGVGGVVEVEQRVAALEVATLRFRAPLAILDGRPPLPTPRPIDLDPVSEVLTFRHLLIDGVWPEDERERPDQARARLLDRRELVPAPVLDVVRVDAVVRDPECGVRARPRRSATRAHV